MKKWVLAMILCLGLILCLRSSNDKFEISHSNDEFEISHSEGRTYLLNKKTGECWKTVDQDFKFQRIYNYTL